MRADGVPAWATGRAQNAAAAAGRALFGLQQVDLERRLVGRDVALDDVRRRDVEAHAGEVLAIVGESGSGKTVTANTLLGLLPETATLSGAVLIRGRRAPIVGGVAMDAFMVDVTHIPEAKLGEEAVILGRQNDEEITAQELASWQQSVVYEALVRWQPRLPRLYRNSPNAPSPSVP